ncbi:Pyruvate dehydrogenase E1 component subunit beta-2 [Spatholobus suberectus]|nr:Pyruvate dehydrogenase E1 component subunit beta-2 [Spatholobus suberectus]
MVNMQMIVKEALNSTLDEEMSADPEVFLMGEEVREYQATYKGVVCACHVKELCTSWHPRIVRFDMSGRSLVLDISAAHIYILTLLGVKNVRGSLEASKAF